MIDCAGFKPHDPFLQQYFYNLADRQAHDIGVGTVYPPDKKSAQSLNRVSPGLVKGLACADIPVDFADGERFKNNVGFRHIDDAA